MRIDAHQHYWHPARADYGWMPPDDPVLSRPYRPADLAPSLAAHGIERTVLVQAAPTVEETAYLLGIADADSRVAGVVGWIDFERPSERATLERLATHPKLVGLRPMIQNIPDDTWMLRGDLAWAYEAMAELDLTFDALGFPRHLKPFHALLTRHPRLRVVIDHAMKPRIRDHSPERYRHWADGMTALARDTGAFCKLSGLVTEAGPGWTVETLRPYAEHLMEAFGPGRVLWGSDWPVCLRAATYDAWHEAAEALTAALSEDERAAVFGATAARAYCLHPRTGEGPTQAGLAAGPPRGPD